MIASKSVGDGDDKRTGIQIIADSFHRRMVIRGNASFQ